VGAGGVGREVDPGAASALGEPRRERRARGAAQLRDEAHGRARIADRSEPAELVAVAVEEQEQARARAELDEAERTPCRLGRRREREDERRAAQRVVGLRAARRDELADLAAVRGEEGAQR